MRTKEQVLTSIKHIQELLGLSQWRFKLSNTEPAAGNLMECAINRQRLIAHIRISQEAWAAENIEFHKLLIHEMLHPLMDPLRERFEDIIKLSLPAADHSKVSTIHDRELERIVEQLAQVFYNTQS